MIWDNLIKTFQHRDFLALTIFGTETFRHRDFRHLEFSWLGFLNTHKLVAPFLALLIGSFSVPDPNKIKIFGIVNICEPKSLYRNVYLQKILCAKNSSCPRFPMLKLHVTEHPRFLMPKIPSAKKSSCWHEKCPCQNVHETEHPRCRNIPLPKFFCAKKSTCQKVPVPKNSHVETFPCWNVRMAKRCTCQNVPVMNHPCRYDSFPNVPCRNGL